MDCKLTVPTDGKLTRIYIYYAHDRVPQAQGRTIKQACTLRRNAFRKGNQPEPVLTIRHDAGSPPLSSPPLTPPPPLPSSSHPLPFPRALIPLSDRTESSAREAQDPFRRQKGTAIAGWTFRAQRRCGRRERDAPVSGG